MAFGATAGIFIFIIIIVVASLMTDASIAGIVLSSIAKNKGKKYGKPLLAVSIIMVVISSVMLISGSVFYIRERIALDFPEETSPKTDIIIEERGYQENTFTVNGVVYERVEIDNLVVIGGEELSGPIFSYKETFLFFDRWDTYDKLENDNGFNIVVGKASDIFCPVDEKEAVIEYYSDDDNYEWYFDDGYYYNLVNGEGQKVLSELLETRRNNPETIRINTTGYDEYYFEQLSKDNLFFKDEIKIFANNGKYYLEASDQEPWGDTKNPGAEVVEIDKDTAKKLNNILE